VICNIFSKWEINIDFVYGKNIVDGERALSKPTKCVFIEIPLNSTLETIDLKLYAELIMFLQLQPYNGY
jgi:cystathionine beta-lyase/cystathionine gamma-synthase